MKIEAQGNMIVLKEIFINVMFETVEGNSLYVCMRDDTFEIVVEPKGKIHRKYRVNMENSEIENPGTHINKGEKDEIPCSNGPEGNDSAEKERRINKCQRLIPCEKFHLDKPCQFKDGKCPYQQEIINIAKEFNKPEDIIS